MELQVGVKLPGEEIVVAVLKMIAEVRATQTPDIQLYWDLRLLEIDMNWSRLWGPLGWKRLPALEAHVVEMEKRGLKEFVMKPLPAPSNSSST